MNSIDFLDAAKRIEPYVRQTPIFEATHNGYSFTLKLEHLQVGGSFKYRGAMNAMLQLPSDVRRVITASGGNHGIAVALASQQVGVQAMVVVPDTASPEKVAQLRTTGADLVSHGRQYADAESYARSIVEPNDRFIHPFDNPEIIAGQGTTGLELAQQVSARCDAVVVAVGGGGLIAGVATALAENDLAVFGAEPEGIPTVFNALRKGRPVDVAVDSITASSLGARSTSEVNLALVRDHTKSVVLVRDSEILSAQKILWNEYRLAVEPGAAVGFAAVLNDRIEASHPCVVLCGANAGFPISREAN